MLANSAAHQNNLSTAANYVKHELSRNYLFNKAAETGSGSINSVSLLRLSADFSTKTIWNGGGWKGGGVDG